MHRLRDTAVGHGQRPRRPARGNLNGVRSHFRESLLSRRIVSMSESRSSPAPCARPRRSGGSHSDFELHPCSRIRPVTAVMPCVFLSLCAEYAGCGRAGPGRDGLRRSKPAVSIAPPLALAFRVSCQWRARGDVDAIAGTAGRIERLPGVFSSRPPDANSDRGEPARPLVRRRWRGPAARSLRGGVNDLSLVAARHIEGECNDGGRSFIWSARSATMPARQNVRANVSDGFRLA